MLPHQVQTQCGCVIVHCPPCLHKRIATKGGATGEGKCEIHKNVVAVLAMALMAGLGGWSFGFQ